MNAAEILSTLKYQEVALHQASVRSSATEISKLLHEKFSEFGRSGNQYNYVQIIKYLVDEEPSDPIFVWSQDYEVRYQCENTALITYKSAHIIDDNELIHHSLRSSLWVKSDSGWQLIFHQGTPTAAFEKSLVNESVQNISA